MCLDFRKMQPVVRTELITSPTVSGLLELLITIQLLLGNAPCRGNLQKEKTQIDRVVSQLSSVYIFTSCTRNINDNVLPFAPTSSK